MPSNRPLARALAGAALALALVSACGGGGGTASAPTTTKAPTCTDKILVLATRDDVVAAATTAHAFPPPIATEFRTLLEGPCGTEINALPADQLQDLIAKVDPAVVQVILSSSA